MSSLAPRKLRLLAPLVGVAPAVGVALVLGATPGAAAAEPAAAGCSAQATPQAAGSYAVEATHFGDVVHTSSIGKATLVAGAPGASPVPIGALSFSAIGAPSSKLVKGPPNKTRSWVAKFVFSSEGSGVRFECRVDKALFKACTSPYSVKVSPGSHIFRVRAISAAGTYDEDPEQHRWTVLPPSGKAGR